MALDSSETPWFQPPDWLFGPVWTILYFMMAGSLVLSWGARDELENSTLVFILFGIQLSLNLAWTSVFNSEQYTLSLLMLLGMIVATAYYAYLVYDTVPAASALVWPYIAWLTFASILNVWYLQEGI